MPSAHPGKVWNRCLRCKEQIWMHSGYLPVDDDVYLVEKTGLNWIATCRTCNNFQIQSGDEMKGGIEWKRNSMWGPETTKRQYPFLYDGGSERPGWDCLKEDHNITVGFVPVGYLQTSEDTYLIDRWTTVYKCRKCTHLVFEAHDEASKEPNRVDCPRCSSGLFGKSAHYLETVPVGYLWVDEGSYLIDQERDGLKRLWDALWE